MIKLKSKIFRAIKAKEIETYNLTNLGLFSYDSANFELKNRN